MAELHAGNLDRGDAVITIPICPSHKNGQRVSVGDKRHAKENPKEEPGNIEYDPRDPDHGDGECPSAATGKVSAHYGLEPGGTSPSAPTVS